MDYMLCAIMPLRDRVYVAVLERPHVPCDSAVNVAERIVSVQVTVILERSSVRFVDPPTKRIPTTQALSGSRLAWCLRLILSTRFFDLERKPASKRITADKMPAATLTIPE
jgi:hypothetical protein